MSGKYERNVYNVSRKLERKLSPRRPRYRQKDIIKMIFNIVSECELDLTGTFEGKIAVFMNMIMYLRIKKKHNIL